MEVMSFTTVFIAVFGGFVMGGSFVVFCYAVNEAFERLANGKDPAIEELKKRVDNLEKLHG